MNTARSTNIRARREALSLTLDHVAQRLGIDKSYLSRIETGQRQATDEQAKELADVLVMPVELVLLECGRLPSDVRGAIESDAAGVTAVVRAHAEQDAIVYPAAPAVAPTANGPRVNGSRDRRRVKSDDIIPGAQLSHQGAALRHHAFHRGVQ
jgi:transcriptional regulator with XRE-family HTH domain